MFLQTNWHIKIERGIVMASIESSSKIRRRTKSLKMKAATSLVDLVSKVSNSSKSKEVERIIMHDGFGYFPTHND